RACARQGIVDNASSRAGTLLRSTCNEDGAYAGRYELKQLARARGYRLLTKPVKLALLRAFLSALQNAKKR
ncbi:hypothetical protein, partial [Xanthomonas sp. WHRI 8812E]|uniref:hypothetical protein n=1 Tax=Xanthomonas sp. WHRI 8812E TaxID=3059651 RepID=UPI0032E42590